MAICGPEPPSCRLSGVSVLLGWAIDAVGGGDIAVDRGTAHGIGGCHSCGIVPVACTSAAAPRIFGGRLPRTRHQSFGSLAAIMCSTAAVAILAVSLVRLAPDDVHRKTSIVTTNPTVISEIQAAPEPVIVSQALVGLWQGMQAEYAELSQETTRALDGWGGLPESAGLLPVLPRRIVPASPLPGCAWIAPSASGWDRRLISSGMPCRTMCRSHRNLPADFLSSKAAPMISIPSTSLRRPLYFAVGSLILIGSQPAEKDSRSTDGSCRRRCGPRL